MARESRIAKTPEEQAQFDKERDRRRAYYWKNREKSIAWMRTWQKKHRKKWNKYQRDYQKAHPETVHAWNQNAKRKREAMSDGKMG